MSFCHGRIISTNASNFVDRPSMDESNAPVIPTISSDKPPATVVEVTASVDFLGWNTPPYCELCHVYFAGEPCSKLHFDGKNHRNRLQTWKKYQDHENASTPASKNVLCRLCWKEMNTQTMFDIHCQSPAHLKEEPKRVAVLKLKEAYRQLRVEQHG